MKWRVIELSENNAFLNMAIDQAVSESIQNGAPPTIRFYSWLPSAVSIGYFQSIEREVDLLRCKDLGVDVVRRRTGGGAVYHDHNGEITYSVIAPESVFPKDIILSYKEICGWICDSLSLLGLTAEFKPINDIIVNGKKISGNAQTRRNGVLLQHGTILYTVDPEKMFSVLKVPDEKIKDKMIASVKERVTSISDHTKISKNEAYKAFVEGFTKGKTFEFGELCESEINRAKELEVKYKEHSWNHMR
ncbi:lipoate--protein ligase family protein [Candidatus Micrarchaeota archaeon]|nr:lipoate--protein ligase family protein [Candidatus Micrarchaeota archaeon]